MSEITAKLVLEWIETAERDDLVMIADELIERQFAVHPSDVETDVEWEDEPDVDPALLDEASARLRRREYRETLHVLAIALGRDFFDLDTLPLGAA